MKVALALGAVLLIVGAAGSVIVPEHAPQLCTPLIRNLQPCSSWSQTAYDAGRIATKAALILGALLALYGLSVSVRRSQGTNAA
jgi:hypothetical protein